MKRKYSFICCFKKIINFYSSFKKVFFDARFYFLTFLLVLVVILTLLSVDNYDQSVENYFSTANEQFNNDYRITIDLYEAMSQVIFDMEINEPEILNILELGIYSGDKEVEDRARQQLLKKLQPIYEKITRHYFRQLHFQDANNISILRFHRPSRYGDDLTGIRTSVEYVNREKKQISGFEEGRIFNGYRFVYPLSNHTRHLGSVEISVSYASIIEQFKKRFNKDVEFILSSEQVFKKVFDQEQTNYKKWIIDDDYLMDISIMNENSFLLTADEQSKKLIIKQLKEKSCDMTDPFSFLIKLDNKKTLITFLPINNFENKKVAYLYTIGPITRLKEIQKIWISSMIVLILFIVLLIFFILYYFNTQHKLTFLATHDGLTELYNRRNIFNILESELGRANRYARPLSLIMIDIDHFKVINDNQGHPCGDQVLTKVAKLINENLRASDLLGRYGGEEFLVILPETSRKQSYETAEKIRKAIAAHEFSKGGPVTLCCGLSSLQTEKETLSSLIARADQELYKAKNAGRNRTSG